MKKAKLDKNKYKDVIMSKIIQLDNKIKTKIQHIWNDLVITEK
jgi:hypothetical protein